MSRLKFRALNNAKQEMLSWNEIRHDSDLLWSIMNNEYYATNPPRYLWVVMQWTGLCDRNGVEVYESDICRFYEYPEEPGFFFGTAEIFWAECGFCWNPIKCLNEYGFSMLDSSAFWNDDFEIIGNIHQHPELLEETNHRASEESE